MIDDSIIELKNKIRKLPDKQKVIIALQAAGYSQKESGTIIGVTGSTVGIIFKRAIGKLRKEVDDEL